MQTKNAPDVFALQKKTVKGHRRSQQHLQIVVVIRSFESTIICLGKDRHLISSMIKKKIPDLKKYPINFACINFFLLLIYQNSTFDYFLIYRLTCLISSFSEAILFPLIHFRIPWQLHLEGVFVQRKSDWAKCQIGNQGGPAGSEICQTKLQKRFYSNFFYKVGIVFFFANLICWVKLDH